MSESFQAHLSVLTVNGANPTAQGMPERCSVTRTAEGVLTVKTTEAIATGSADIAATIGLTAGAVINVIKGGDDFTWTINTFTIAAGIFVPDDVPGALITLTLKRVDPA
jgi:hypothetical protein